ncbi:MAG TPA: hypothetical protein VI386_05925 [Candidatus Sulfotelmatobacter sp.]
MKYPSLLRLQVANPHRHMMDLRHPVIDDQRQLRELLSDLDSIEQLAPAVQTVSELGREEAVRQLRARLNFASSLCIVKLEADWLRKLEKAIANDRAILTSLLENTYADLLVPLSASPGESAPQTRFEPIPLQVRNVSGQRVAWRRSLLVSSDRLWFGHIQLKIQEGLTLALPGEWKVQSVRVDEAAGNEPSARSEGKAVAWKDSSSGKRYLLVDLSVPGWGMSRMLIQFRLFAQKLSRRSVTEKELWRALAKISLPKNASILGDLASLALEGQRLRREFAPANCRPAELLHDVANYEGGPTDLVRRLSMCVPAFVSLNPEERAALIQKLPPVIENTDWNTLVNHLPAVASALGMVGAAGDYVFDSLCHAAPKDLDSTGLQLLASVAQALQLRGIPRLSFVSAVLNSTFCFALSPAARTELRAILSRAPATSATATIQTIIAAFQHRKHGDFRRALVGVRPLVGELLPDEWETLSQQFRTWLSQECPAPPLPAWDVDGQYSDYLEALNECVALHEFAESPSWSTTKLLRLVGPLLVDDHTQPTYLPGSFWPALRSWLAEGKCDSNHFTQYQLDVAAWHLANYWDRRTPAPLMKQCGSWLREFGVKTFMFARLVDRFVSRLTDLPSGPDFNHERQVALEGLCLLCAPSRPSLRFEAPSPIADPFDAIWDSFELELWRTRRSESDAARDLAGEWQSWVELAVSDAEDQRWKAAWDRLTIRGLLFDDSEERVPLWADRVARVSEPEITFRSLDLQLRDFEVRVRAHPTPDFDGARRRLDELRKLLQARKRIRADNSAWIRWAVEAELLRAIGPEEAFLLYSAALRVSDESQLENRVKDLWPGVPVRLLLDSPASGDILRDFLDNCDRTNSFWTEEAPSNLARELLSRRAEPEQHFEAISRMAKMFLRVPACPSASDLAEYWERVRHVPDLSPEWKLRFASRLYETPGTPETRAQGAPKAFFDEVRHCLRSLAETESGEILEELAKVLIPGPRGRPVGHPQDLEDQRDQ